MSPQGYVLLPDSVFMLTQRAVCQVLMYKDYGIDLTPEQHELAWTQAKELIEGGWPDE